MTSPSSGLMYDVTPTGVSIVGHPANKSKFLVMKNEEGRHNMDKILEIVKSAESENETDLIDTMKARGSDTDAIDAVVGIKRVLHAFRDVISEADFNGLAESANFKVKKAGEGDPVTPDVKKEINAKGKDLQKHDDEEIQKLRDTVARLTEESQVARLTKMAEEVKIGDKAEILKTLVAVDNSGGDVNSILEVLKSASAAAEQGLGTELGSSASGDDKTGFEAIEAEAIRIAAEDGIDVYEAYTRIDKSNRDLVQKYYDE